MLKARVMPCLLLDDGALIKTVKFRDPAYVGDPINAVRIYNECEVDELIALDVRASERNTGPDTELVKSLASECFMPLAYGGGIHTFEQAATLFKLGVEKVAINTANFDRPELIGQIAAVYGSQAVIGAMDVRRSLFGAYHVTRSRGVRDTKRDPAEWAKELVARGAGELMLYAIDRDGTWSGYDLDLIKKVSSAVNVPLIAVGGAGKIEDFGAAVCAGASAIAAGAMVVYQKKGMGVLINYPSQAEIARVLG